MIYKRYALKKELHNYKIAAKPIKKFQKMYVNNNIQLPF